MIKRITLVITALVFGFTLPAMAQVTGNSRATAAVKNFSPEADIKRITTLLNMKGLNAAARSRLHLTRANEEAMLKRFDKAIPDLTTVISLDPANITAFAFRGDCYFALKNFDKAADDYQHLIDHAPLDKTQKAMAYYQLGRAYIGGNKFSNAQAADSASIALNPAFAPAYADRAEAYAQSGKFDKAIQDITIAMAGYDDKPVLLSELLRMRGDYKRGLKQEKEAVNDYSVALKANPENKRALVNRGICYSNSRDYQLALTDFQKAIPMLKNDLRILTFVYDDCGFMETGLQHYDEAIKYDSLAIASDSTYVQAYFNMANARSQQGDYKHSNADFLQGIHFSHGTSKIQDGTMYAAMAHNYYFLNDYQQVIEMATKSIKANPDYWASYFERGRAYLRLNQKDLAANDFKEVLTRDTSKTTSEYAFSLYYLGRLDEAVAAIQSSFLKTTDDFELNIDYYNMACLFSVMNKKEEALNYLKKCLDGGYNKKYVMADSDFDNIRNTPEYKQLLGLN